MNLICNKVFLRLYIIKILIFRYIYFTCRINENQTHILPILCLKTNSLGLDEL